MPTLTQLEYILAVDTYRHFGKAAKACHVSQPTLSQQIQKLEDELSIILFDRIQKPVVPTDDGRRFIAQAKVVLSEQEKLIYTARNRSHGLKGEFRLAVIPTVATYLVPVFLRNFSKNCPQVELYIEELKTETIIDELRNDRIDGAILATPLQQQGFKEHPLYYEPFSLYASKGHPLLKKQKISPKDLDAAEMWMLKDGNCFKTQVSSYCSISPSQDSVFKNIHFQSGSLDTLCHVIQKNHGYTLIPDLLTTLMSRADVRTHVRPFVPPVPTREISFVYRRDHWKLEMIKALKHSVMKSLPEDLNTKRGKELLVVEIC
ncbi:MAG: LysR family transcriptional regulator [Oligoflexales bacterium]|nr:LysR family transcriptional regulator [Oligoflexales bacterium]